MTVTATEFKKNLGKYLDMAIEEDVLITKNGKPIAKLSNPYEERLEIAKSLFGILKEYDDGRDYDEVKWEAMKERYEIND